MRSQGSEILRLRCMIIIAVVMLSSNSAASSLRYSPTIAEIQCISEHLDGYIDLGKDPLILFADICPRLEPNADDVLAHSSNELPTFKTGRQSRDPDILILRSYQLRCMVKKFNSGVYVPSTGFKGEGRVDIELSDCTAPHAR